MTKSKRNLLVSMLILVLTVAIAGGSTYAWFTTNQKVEIADINMSVTTGTQGLYVSTTKTGTYKTYLTTDDLKEAGFDSANVKMDNITTQNGVNMVTQAGANVPHTGNTGSNSYVSYKIYFRATGDQTTTPIVDLSTLDMTTTNPGKDFYNDFKDAADKGMTISGAAYGNTTVGDIAYGAVIPASPMHAMRMSYETKQHFDTSPETQPSRTWTWDPFKGNAATYSGVTKDDNSVLAENFGVFIYNETKKTQGAAGDVITTIPTLAPTSTTAQFTKGIVPTSVDPTDKGTGVLQFAWNAATRSWEGELTVRIWIEGFDGDCINSILAGQVKSSQHFTIREVTTP